jgi:hypothetical protein
VPSPADKLLSALPPTASLPAAGSDLAACSGSPRSKLPVRGAPHGRCPPRLPPTRRRSDRNPVHRPPSIGTAAFARSRRTQPPKHLTRLQPLGWPRATARTRSASISTQRRQPSWLRAGATQEGHAHPCDSGPVCADGQLPPALTTPGGQTRIARPTERAESMAWVVYFFKVEFRSYAGLQPVLNQVPRDKTLGTTPGQHEPLEAPQFMEEWLTPCRT